MKTIFTLLTLAFLAFNSFGQTATYMEFTEQNFTITDAVKHIESGGSIWQITNNTNPVDIRTYIYYQRFTSDQNIPNPPNGWLAKEVTYDQANDIYFNFSSPTVYIITEDSAVYVKIN